jgi:hypothetical protein
VAERGKSILKTAFVKANRRASGWASVIRLGKALCSIQAARFLRRGLRLLAFVTTLCTAGPRLSTTVSAVRSITLSSAAESGANSSAM